MLSSSETFKLYAKEHFLFFCKFVLGMEIPPHFYEWNNFLENYDRLLIECARGHGKSWFISRALPLWISYRGEACSILLVSYSEEQAVDLMRLIEQEVLSNPHLEGIRPTTDTTWQSTLFTFPGNVRIKAVGFGTSVRGQHPDLIIVDDPLKDRGALDPEFQYDYYMGALMGTCKKNTKVIVIGTPLDPGDLLSRLENNPVYYFRSYPGDDGFGEGVGNPLFPHLFPKEKLEQFKKERGSLVYAREIRLQRIDPETQVFKDQYRVFNEKMEFPPFVSVRTLIDPAISEKENACDTAITTWGMDERNNFWELDTRLIHSDDTNAMLNEVLKAVSIYRDNQDYAVVFEAELFQRLLAFEFRRLCNERGLDCRVIEVTHTGTLGKHQRIQGLQPVWEARALHLLPESSLIKQFSEYRPRAKNIRLDGIDALSWIKDERVCVPMVHTTPLIGEVAPEARE